MRGMYLVEAPFQLISAYESIEQYNINKFEIIIRYSNNDINDKQLLKVSQIFFNKKNLKFIYINNGKKSFQDYFVALYLMLYVSIKSIFYDYIFIGNIESPLLSKIARIYEKKIILLDDGIKLITMPEIIKRYNVFTMMEEIVSLKKVKINKFKRLKQLIENYSYKDEVMIIGSKLSESNIIKEDDYINYIKYISSEYKDQKIKYIVHRGESIEKIQKINDIKNITIIKLELPIELIGLEIGYIPKKAISFYSAALISLQKVYPNIEVEAYRINNVNNKFKKIVSIGYTYISKYVAIKELNYV